MNPLNPRYDILKDKGGALVAAIDEIAAEVKNAMANPPSAPDRGTGSVLAATRYSLGTETVESALWSVRHPISGCSEWGRPGRRPIA
jgi:hypothetical protein